MKIQNGKMNARIEFLASEKFVSFTGTVPQSKGVLQEGQKIAKAGTVLPENDATAKGILLADVDVTQGDSLGAMVVEGYVFLERLPEAPSTEAKTALKEIKFV